MSNVRSELMEQYKDLARRWKRGAEFMDGPASLAEKEKWLPEFLKIIKKACAIAYQLGLTEEDILRIEAEL